MSSDEIIKKLEAEMKASNDEVNKLLVMEKELHQKYLNSVKRNADLQEAITIEKKKISNIDLENQFRETITKFGAEIAEHVALAAKHLQTAIDISEREGIQFKSPIISLIELEKYCEIDYNYDRYVPVSMNKKWGEISSFIAKEYKMYDDVNGWVGVWMPSSLRC